MPHKQQQKQKRHRATAERLFVHHLACIKLSKRRVLGPNRVLVPSPPSPNHPHHPHHLAAVSAALSAVCVGVGDWRKSLLRLNAF